MRRQGAKHACAYACKMEVEKELQPPDKFPFPFEPYCIQEEFMRALYSTLEKGCIGIFESPTGTVRNVKDTSINYRSEKAQ